MSRLVKLFVVSMLSGLCLSANAESENRAIVISGEDCTAWISHPSVDLGVGTGLAESDLVQLVGQYAGGPGVPNNGKAMCQGTHAIAYEKPFIERDVPCTIVDTPFVADKSILIATPGGHWSLICDFPKGN